MVPADTLLDEDPDIVTETYTVYDLETEEWRDIGVVYDQDDPFFIDGETREPLEARYMEAIDRTMPDRYDDITLFQRGDEGRGNRFLTTFTDEEYGTFLSVKSYQDGEIQTLLTAQYDRDDEDEQIPPTFRQINDDLYVLREQDGEVLVEDTGEDLERVSTHYGSIGAVALDNEHLSPVECRE